jgi:glutathione S-transferase
MPELILHHFASSPFSEKIRLIFGAKKLAWKSVAVPWILPKPDVVALTGGYRKTPFLQVGADIYCDTTLICDVLEHVQPEPTLYPPHLKGVCRVFAQWADTTLFWAAMGHNTQPKGAAHIFRDMPREAMQAFMDDRKAMGSAALRLRPGDATSAYRSYLRRIARMVEEHDFLFGTDPCVADFAAYHPLWYTRTQASVVAGVLGITPAVLEWMDRIQAFGHGMEEPFDAEHAIALARESEPLPPGQNLLVDSAFQDDHGIPLGARVTVAGEVFGPETTEGELLAATRTHYTLRREDSRAGVVHVHFPRIGYVLRRVDAS